MRLTSPHRARQCETCGSPPDAGDRCLECASLDRNSMPARAEQRRPAPDGYRNSPAWKATAGQESNGALWLHQSLALDKLEKGQNVVTATGTASGKSLIFQLAALRRVIENPDDTVIVFYPLKALSHDQMRRWKQAAQDIGLAPDIINNIDGDIKDFHLRNRILDQTRILIATPDICHAWLLRHSSGDAQQRFLSRLALVVIDESHVYESVLGSNGAYLMRRLAAAAAESGSGPPQFCAATATSQDPATHLEALTGLPFTAVEEASNGSPRQERTIFHLAAEGKYPDRIYQVAELISAILRASDEAQIIAFADSRQGVERIVAACGRRDVFPYRGGYKQDDRRIIEQGLHDNRVRGVVSTSALELGIDMPDLNYGINLGLPNSRKRFHQRLGRIGRRKPGRFVILEDPYTLLLHGENLKEYCEQEVEPSRMYLENVYVQEQQAACLRRELSDRRRTYHTLPQSTSWPSGFDQVVKAQQNSNKRTNSNAPHRDYGLRNTGNSTEIDLFQQKKTGREYLGPITLEQAIREAYPGALYRHNRQTYIAGAWFRPKRDKPYILLKKTAKAADTKPINRRAATVRLSPDGLIEGNLRQLPQGIIAEVYCDVDWSVEGYESRNRKFLYRTEGKPGLTRKHYEYDTTGVLLIVRQDWFSGPSQAETRKAVAFALRQHLCYRTATPAGQVAYIWQNIGMDNQTSVTALEDAILIYDSIPGGLRLSSDIYHSLDHYATVLSKSVIAEESLEASWVDPIDARRFQQWLNGTDGADPAELPLLAPTGSKPTGENGPAGNPNGALILRVFKAGSTVIANDGRKYRIESYRSAMQPNGAVIVKYQCRRDDGIPLEMDERAITRAGQAWNWEMFDTATERAMDLPTLE